jgi:hypothetical protein
MLYGKEVVRLRRGASFGELGAQEKKEITGRRASLEDEPEEPAAAALRRASVISMVECEFLTLDAESYSRLVSQHIAQKQTDQQLTLLQKVRDGQRRMKLVW